MGLVIEVSAVLTPDPGDFILSGIQALVTAYSVNLEWDVASAQDWSLPDDEHSRTSNDWGIAALGVACSPKTAPITMRVSTAHIPGEEICMSKSTRKRRNPVQIIRAMAEGESMLALRLRFISSWRLLNPRGCVGSSSTAG